MFSGCDRGWVASDWWSLQRVENPRRFGVRRVLAEMMTEHIKWIQMYEVAFSSSKGSALNQWRSDQYSLEERPPLEG